MTSGGLIDRRQDAVETPPAHRRVRARLPRGIGPGVAWIVAILLPFWLSEGQLSTATFVVIGAIGALGLGVLTGYAGQISLGQAFFLAVGAYTAAVLGADHHWNAILWIPAAGL